MKEPEGTADRPEINSHEPKPATQGNATDSETTPTPPPDSQTSQVDDKPENLSQPLAASLALILLFLSNVPLAFLIWLWPEPRDLDAPRQIQFLWCSMTMSPEQQILLVVTFCGLLGGSIQMLLRVREDFKSGHLYRKDVVWYFLTPPIGAILAVAFYLVVRGGFFASGTSVKDVNVFAFGGIGVLVGLFADVATQRLELIFEAAYPSPDPKDRRDSRPASTSSAEHPAAPTA